MLAIRHVTTYRYARTFPFSYSADEIPDLGRTTERHYPDPEHKVDAWAKRFAVPAARDPRQAVPLAGEWQGAPADYLGMEVAVTVTSQTAVKTTPA